MTNTNELGRRFIGKLPDGDCYVEGRDLFKGPATPRARIPAIGETVFNCDYLVGDTCEALGGENCPLKEKLTKPGTPENDQLVTFDVTDNGITNTYSYHTQLLELTCGDSMVELTPKEGAVMDTLARSQDRVFTSQELFLAMNEPDTQYMSSDEATVRVYVSRINGKCTDTFRTKPILNVRKSPKFVEGGYIIRSQVPRITRTR